MSKITVNGKKVTRLCSKATQLTASLRRLAYISVWAKNAKRLLMDRLELDDAVLAHWGLKDIKDAIRNTAGLLYFMDGTAGKIKTEQNEVRFEFSAILVELTKAILGITISPYNINIDKGTVVISGKQLKIGKFVIKLQNTLKSRGGDNTPVADELNKLIDKFSLAKPVTFLYRVTADPGEVLRMSCGKDKLGKDLAWSSCMSPGGEASYGPITDVLAGHAVMYFYKKTDSKYNTPTGRNILRASISDGAPIIIISPSTKGNGASPDEIEQEIKNNFPDIESEIGGEGPDRPMIADGIYDDAAGGPVSQSPVEMEEAYKELVNAFGERGLVKRDKYQDVRDIAEEDEQQQPKDVEYKNDEGKLHRLDGPAYIGVDGTKSWYQNGLKHRTDGPAVEFADGSKEWYVNGQRHRVDGPAYEGASGSKEWWVEDKQYTQQEFEAKFKVYNYACRKKR